MILHNNYVRVYFWSIWQPDWQPMNSKEDNDGEKKKRTNMRIREKKKKERERERERKILPVAWTH